MVAEGLPCVELQRPEAWQQLGRGGLSTHRQEHAGPMEGYPRFPKVFSLKELRACYTPSAEELDWATRSTRGKESRLGLLVLLKVFQQLTETAPQRGPTKRQGGGFRPGRWTDTIVQRKSGAGH